MINKPLLLIIMAGICGGNVYPLIKIAETYNIPKFSYIFWESLFVVIIVSFIALIKNQKKLLNKNDITYYSFCAVTNIVIPQTLFFTIAPNVAANILSLIIVLTPILVYMASAVFLKESLNINKGLGVILGLGGIVVLLAPKLLETDTSVNIYWFAIALLIPINYAFNRIVASKLLPSNSSPYSLTIGLFSCVASISFIGMVLSQQFYIPWHNLHYGDLALFLHALFMAIFYMIFFVIARQNALQNSLSLYIAPLVGMMWGYFLFNEAFTLTFSLSAALVFWGLYLVTKK